MEENPKKPLISIIIPTKDSGATLERCLRSISEQSFRDFELIIVDCHSTDGTAETAKRFGAALIESKAGLPAARNLGFSVSKGRIILSIDSDMILEPSVLAEVAGSMAGYGALIIPEVGYGNDFFSKCKDLEKRCYIDDHRIESARAISREAYRKTGGYDPDLFFGEDHDMHSRLKAGFKIGRISSRIMHDTSAVPPLKQISKAYNYGKTIHNLRAKKNPRGDFALNPANSIFIRHFGKLAREPVHAAGLLVFKSMEYCFGLAGFFSAKTRP
ncbi:MAG: glycosyltransferase family A protein [Candidatus Micrarchaeota archaeon]